MKKAFPSFLIQLLVLSAVAYAILVYSESFNFFPHDTDITITFGDTNNNTLALVPNKDPLWVFKNKKVNWSIDAGATTVKTFSIIGKDSSVNIFDSSEHPPSKQVRKGYGRVKNEAKDRQVYGYSIIWYDYSDKPHTFDPKIAINPSFTAYALAITVGYVIGVLSLTMMFIKKMNKSRTI